MLAELRVRDLGVIADLSLVLGPGLTALTGETGAGKTLVVEALELLVGGRADPLLVRPGAREALVEGRFVGSGQAGATDASETSETSETTDASEAPETSDATEVVLARSVPASGRSRAWVDTRMAPIAALARAGATLVDLHGQHSHQSLLGTAVQRRVLDSFGQVDHGPREAARQRLRAVERALAGLGGDARARAREADLLRFQLTELGNAAITDPEEDRSLSELEDTLAGAAAHRAAAMEAHAAITGGAELPGALDSLGAAMAALEGRAPLAELASRLRGIGAELADAATQARQMGEAIAEDPERLATVRERRQLLAELRRKYGDTLVDVMTFEANAQARLSELESHEEKAAALEAERDQASRALADAEAELLAARRASAPRLAGAVEATLADLAMAGARFEVRVEDGAGDEVSFWLGANRGEAVLPLARVASGGELARTMLAVRLASRRGVTGQAGLASRRGVTDQAGPPKSSPGRPVPDLTAMTLVFDEVDAGVGGEAALAVGRALSALADDHQVLVVTHLPQVAAFADHQLVVRKREINGRTVAEAALLDGPSRVVELSRMLSGQPTSTTARDHARELLTTAARERGG